MSLVALRGRPAGPTPSTLANGRIWNARIAAGETPEQIAESEAVSTAWIRRATALAAQGASRATEGELRCFTRNTALRRALHTMHLDPRFANLPWLARRTWVDAVIAIHLVGDGFALRFRDCGFDDKADFADSFGADESVIDRLGTRGVLDVDPDGISLPPRLGLTARERLLQPTTIPSSRPTGRRPDPRQASLPPMGLPRRDTENAPNIRIADTNNTPLNGTEIPAFSGSGDTENGRAVLSTNNNNSERILSSVVVVDETRASAGACDTESPPNIRIADTIADTENAAPNDGDTEKQNLHRDTEIHLTLTEELLALVGRSGTPEPSEVAEVRAWLLAKTPNQIREAVGSYMERPNAQRAAHLRYFSKRVLGWADAPAPPAPPPPAAPEDPAATVAWTTDHPDNPTLLACWTVIRAALRDRSDTSVWRVLRPMVLCGMDDGELVISLPTAFLRDHVREKHGALIEQAWRDAWPATRRVDFQIRPG